MKIIHNLTEGHRTTLRMLEPGAVFSIDEIPNSILIKTGPSNDDGHTYPVLKFEYCNLRWIPDSFEASEQVIEHPLTFES